MNNDALYRSLMIIRNSPEFAAFREWLEDQRASARDRLEACTEDAQFRREQGIALAYKQIQGLIEDAPKILDKLVDRR
jgi:hypothetical protein